MAQPEWRMARGSAGTEQIPRDRWEQFLNDFSDFNADMPVRVERIGAADTGYGVVADQQPLLDVTLDDEAGTPVILVEVGDPAAVPSEAPRAMRHVLREPTVVWARRVEPAGWDALEIEGRDGAVIVSVSERAESDWPQEDAGKELVQAGLSDREDE